MNEYYCKLVVDDGRGWDKVNEYTWLNWQKALNSKGENRYSGIRCARINGHITIHADGASDRDMAIMCRMLGIRTESTGFVKEGFYFTPEFIKFRSKNGKVVIKEAA